MPSPKQHIFLVPGFFGFANLGDLKYFAHVEQVLAARLQRQGIDGRIVHVKTAPTSSVKKRALRLLQQMVDHAGGDDAPIHLIGHSSGGLDARFLVAAGGSLSSQLPADEMARRVRSVVTVTTPHHGTPTAEFFGTAIGGRVLQLLSLSLIYTLRYGKLPLSAIVQMAGVLVRLDNFVGQSDPLDQLYDELLSDFSADRQREIREFFREVGADQSLIDQLRPAAMETFNAMTRNDPEVRYGCVVAKARAPGVGTTLAAGLSPYAQSSHALYVAIWNLAARHEAGKLPLPGVEQVRALQAAYGELPDIKANDGMCPVLSQLWGEVICCVEADHHDVIGHFDDVGHDPPHFDWITSGSGFKRGQFERLWGAVADFVAKSAAAQAQAAAGPESDPKRRVA